MSARGRALLVAPPTDRPVRAAAGKIWTAIVNMVGAVILLALMGLVLLLFVLLGGLQSYQ